MDPIVTVMGTGPATTAENMLSNVYSMGFTALPVHQILPPKTRRRRTLCHPRTLPTTHGNVTAGPPLPSKNDRAATYAKNPTIWTTVGGATTTTPGKTAMTTETTTGETATAATRLTVRDIPTADTALIATAAHCVNTTIAESAHLATNIAALMDTIVQPALATHCSATDPNLAHPNTGPTIDVPPACEGAPPNRGAPDPHAATAGTHILQHHWADPEPHTPETPPTPTITPSGLPPLPAHAWPPLPYLPKRGPINSILPLYLPMGGPPQHQWCPPPLPLSPSLALSLSSASSNCTHPPLHILGPTPREFPTLWFLNIQPPPHLKGKPRC
ncbi:hypothetical protein FRC08_002801 [Ceratobasidium sp. 394]|nr:hypothetical protein FRC08_002801 [Ceratobasidium sp. 394]